MTEIPGPLLTSVIDSEAIFFVGAGVSQGAGMPSGSELSGHLAEELISSFNREGKDDSVHKVVAQKGNLTEIAQIYDDYFRGSRMRERVQTAIRDGEKNSDTRVFELIAQLPLNDIITTNFDHLIEENQTSSNYSVIVREDDVKRNKRLATNIFKLHGDREDLSSLILTKSDFDNYRVSHPELWAQVCAELKSKTLIVIGYRMEDVTFRQLFAECASQSGRPCYYVTTRDDEFKDTEWERRSAKKLHLSAEDFFRSLVSQIQEAARQPVRFSGAPENSQSDRNPFRAQRAEAIPLSDYLTISQTFVPPLDFNRTLETGIHTVIEGDRGSGKSTLLRYLSIESQLAAGRENPFVAIYAKLKPTLVQTAVRTKYEATDEEWVEFFAHFTNLVVVERALETLSILKSKGLLSFDQQAESKFCSHLSITVLAGAGATTSFEDTRGAVASRRDQCCRLHDRGQVQITTGAAYLSEFVTQMRKLHPRLDKDHYFLCLDEADNLDPEQMKVLVLLMRDRDSQVTFKVGIRTGAMRYEGPSGKTLQFNDDYSIVYTDKFEKSQLKDYVGFLEKLSDARLREGNIGIKSLLPDDRPHPRPAAFYTGFHDYCILSSGIVRTYVTMVKDTIYRAYPEVVSGSVVLQPIPSKLQNDIIGIKSTIHFRNYLQCEHPDEVRILVSTLGDLFKAILALSTQHGVKRTVSQFEVPDFGGVDPFLRKLLEEASGNALFQQPFRARTQEKHRAPFHGYKLHRALVPYFRLELANRWPRTIPAGHINGLLDVISGKRTTAEWVSKLTEKLNFREDDNGSSSDELDNEGADELDETDAQTHLDDFESGVSRKSS